jgi:hypothetical protein
MAAVRRITAADRLLKYERDLDAALGNPAEEGLMRRTARRAGELDVVVVEQPGASSRVFLSEADAGDWGDLLETTVEDLRLALRQVEEILARPPERGRKRR